MTYNVFSGTLNPTQSINQLSHQSYGSLSQPDSISVISMVVSKIRSLFSPRNAMCRMHDLRSFETALAPRG